MVLERLNIDIDGTKLGNIKSSRLGRRATIATTTGNGTLTFGIGLLSIVWSNE